METIIALDPGVTTGICYGYKPTKQEKLYVAPDEARYSLFEMAELLTMFMDYSPGHASIVYEDFQYRNYARAGLDLTPVKIIGVIECIIEEQGTLGKSFTSVKQTPAQGKGHFTDDRLKELGVYAIGLKHGRDATRHLLQWANFGVGGQYFKHSKLEYEMLSPVVLWRLVREGS